MTYSTRHLLLLVLVLVRLLVLLLLLERYMYTKDVM
jgi:hypothetical protein